MDSQEGRDSLKVGVDYSVVFKPLAGSETEYEFKVVNNNNLLGIGLGSTLTTLFLILTTS